MKRFSLLALVFAVGVVLGHVAASRPEPVPDPIAVEITDLAPANGKVKTVTLEPLFVLDERGEKRTVARPEPGAPAWKLAIVYPRGVARTVYATSR